MNMIKLLCFFVVVVLGLHTSAAAIAAPPSLKGKGKADPTRVFLDRARSLIAKRHRPSGLMKKVTNRGKNPLDICCDHYCADESWLAKPACYLGCYALECLPF